MLSRTNTPFSHVRNIKSWQKPWGYLWLATWTAFFILERHLWLLIRFSSSTPVFVWQLEMNWGKAPFSLKLCPLTDSNKSSGRCDAPTRRALSFLHVASGLVPDGFRSVFLCSDGCQGPECLLSLPILNLNCFNWLASLINKSPSIYYHPKVAKTFCVFQKSLRSYIKYK